MAGTADTPSLRGGSERAFEEHALPRTRTEYIEAEGIPSRFVGPDCRLYLAGAEEHQPVVRAHVFRDPDLHVESRLAPVVEVELDLRRAAGGLVRRVVQQVRVQQDN